MKTMAIRLEDELHAQLSVLAQLKETTITDEIRSALVAHLESCKASSELGGRASAVLDEIERESRARQAAIAALFGGSGRTSETAVGNSTTDSTTSASVRKSVGAVAPPAKTKR